MEPKSTNQSMCIYGASRVAQQVKVLAAQAWWPEFDPQNPCKGPGKELTPQSCSLTATLMPSHTCLSPDTMPFLIHNMHQDTK